MRVRSAVMILLLSMAFWPLGCVPVHRRGSASHPSPRALMSVTARPVKVDPLVGAVFLGAADLHTCTGSVLDSSTKNLILTAAHCLSSDTPTTFAPGFTERTGSAGTWTIDAIYLDPRWVAKQDPVADFAIARVSRPDGRSVESVIGEGLTLGTAPAAGTTVTVSGYPARVGGVPIGCRVGTATAPGGFPSLPCVGLNDGTSGSPWRTDNAVVGLTGGLDGGGCDEKVSYSPPFDGHVADLLHRAEAGGPGDTAPEVSANGC